MTVHDLMSMGIYYEEETGVVWHWSQHRRNYPLKPRVQNSRNNVYYLFRHNGKVVAIRKEKILEAYGIKEKEQNKCEQKKNF